MFEKWIGNPGLKDILERNRGARLLPLIPAPDVIHPVIRQTILDRAAQAAQQGWQLVTASMYMDYFISGSRQAYDIPNDKNRESLYYFILAEWLNRDGQYLSQIIDFVWAFTEMATWVCPPHNYGLHQRPGGDGILPDVEDRVFINLISAETGALLSWAVSFFEKELDRVAPQIVRRIRHTLRQRLFIPFLQSDDHWWMGFMQTHHPMNNWNPWIISNLLTALSNTETDPAIIDRCVSKALDCLENYIRKGTYEDGGCDEGPGYWNCTAGSLFDNLEILHTLSGGVIDLFGDPLVKAMGNYLCKVSIGGDRYANFADSNHHSRHAPVLMYRYARATEDADLLNLAYEELDQQGLESIALFRNTTYRGIKNCLTLSQMLQDRARVPSSAAALNNVLPRLQILTARQRQDKTGFFLACKGGHNQESHNHNDVGSFILFRDQKPVFIDTGVGAYTIKTFGPDRYTIWSMTSSYHNCPEYNGVPQKDGKAYAAEDVSFETTPERASMQMQLKNAYPSQAGILSAVRTVVMERGEETLIRVTDAFELESETSEIAFRLITPLLPRFEENRFVLDLEGDTPPVRCEYTPGFSASAEPIELQEKGMINDWKTSTLYRITIRPDKPLQKGVFELVCK